MKFKTEKLISNRGNVVAGPLHIYPKINGDSRGFFYESWNEREWADTLGNISQSYIPFVQDNHSSSSKGVLRGLHFQTRPHAQGKLVRCIKGEVYDVAVDIRKDSKTFSEWVGVFLNPNISNQIWIPEGFAHGFLSLEESNEINYKVTDYWSKECEGSLLWNDKDIDIKWPMKKIGENKLLLSEKDRNAENLKTFAKKL